MAKPLTPGVFQATFARQAAKAKAAGPSLLTAVAVEVEREAKTNLAKYTHPYGTRTSARVGGPPALVSGTLRRALTHTRPQPIPFGWQVRVGLASGFYPPYPKGGKRTAASKYGAYLERGELRGNGPSAAYPFLVPAFRTVVGRLDTTRLGRLVTADWV